MGASFWTAKRKRFWARAGAFIVGSAGLVATVAYVASRPSIEERAATRGELAAFLSDEHKAAFREGTNVGQKFPVKDAAGVAGSMREWVGERVSFEGLFPGPGVEFMGAGKSAVPGTGKSAHVRVRVGGAGASVFVKEYRKLPELDDGAAYTLPGRGLGEGAPPITVWRRGGVVCYLVAGDAGAMRALSEGMKAPEPKKAY